MNANTACAVARQVHAGQLSRSGEPLIDHVERVARAVPADICAVAYLHDVLERCAGAEEALRRLRLSDHEWSVLALLARLPNETYATYVMRVARADGKPGRVARTIKLADLEDHIGNGQITGPAPDYAWARRVILQSQRARGEGWALAG